jgi:hypothetical protein
MIELRDENLIACVQGAPDGGGEREVQRGHVLTERNALGTGGAEKGCQGFSRGVHTPVDFAGRRKIAVRVYIAGPVKIRHGLDDGARHLTAAGPIQKYQAMAFSRALQRRETLTATFAVFGGKCHYSRS